MKEFFDTSVLVASFWGGHRDHGGSLKRVAAANKKNSARALHTLAEVYRPSRPYFSSTKCGIA